jgi:hypothetical protein
LIGQLELDQPPGLLLPHGRAIDQRVYLLAALSTPDEARDAVIARVAVTLHGDATAT